MNFQTIKANIVSILGTAAAGRYRVVGYQQQGVSADEIVDTSRLVQVFYVAGNFPKSGASLRGPIRHEMTFRVQLMASKAASVDLSVLESSTSTEAEKAAALAATSEAASLADASIDEMFSAVYGVMMDNSDLDLGMDPPAGSRWVSGFQKNPPHPIGEYVTITGSFDVECVYYETLSGVEALNEIGVATVIDVDIENNDDNATKQGVTVSNEGP